jgi:hypothetical protein
VAIDVVGFTRRRSVAAAVAHASSSKKSVKACLIDPYLKLRASIGRLTGMPTDSRRVYRTSINPYAFSCGVAGIIALTKLASYLTPYKLYFSFAAFLYSHRSLYRWEALTLKLLIPTLVGFLLFYVPFRWMQIGGSGRNYRAIYRYLAQQATLTARAVGFFSSLLLAWPFVVFWDVLMDPSLQHLQFPFLCVYSLYFVSYSYFASLGVDLARLALRRSLPHHETQQVSSRLTLLEAVRTSFLGVVTSAIATYFASVLGGGQ